jgi:hypothetical protein
MNEEEAVREARGDENVPKWEGLGRRETLSGSWAPWYDKTGDAADSYHIISDKGERGK